MMQPFAYMMKVMSDHFGDFGGGSGACTSQEIRRSVRKQ